MDSYKVNITKQAEESMRDIALYIARNLMNVSAAEGHVEAFLNAIEELSYRAATVKTIPENPWEKWDFAGSVSRTITSTSKYMKIEKRFLFLTSSIRDEISKKV
jgi:hypothetical protein